MSIILYTPATGFPDLEVKIAYGLARVGIEAGLLPELKPNNGFFEVRLNSSKNIQNLNHSLHTLLERILSNPKFYDLGVKAKDKKKYPSVDDQTGFKQRLRKTDLFALYSKPPKNEFLFTKEKACAHKDEYKFGTTKEDKKQLGGLIILASSHAGKPQIRDNRFKDLNLGLCEICGYLNVLGKESFCFTIQIGHGKNRKFVIVTPLIKSTLDGTSLFKLLSIQKTLHNFWLSDVLPLRTFVLCLLSKVPSLSEIVNKLKIDFHLSLLSKDNRGDTVVEQTLIVNTITCSEFINYSAFNIATIERLLDKGPKISSLLELINVINKIDLFKSLPKFARAYTIDTTSKNAKNINLLYPETARYLLKEVAMIKPEIIENPALKSLARTLRYFIRERKYGYADDIRNAKKDSRDFEETVAKMLREGRLRLEQKEKIHLPTEDELKEVFRIANEDFESMKTALVILAFSFPARAEDHTDTESLKEVKNA